MCPKTHVSVLELESDIHVDLGEQLPVIISLSRSESLIGG